MCIQTGKTVDETDRMRFESQELYLKSEAEMRMLFPDLSEAYDNTEKIAKRCNFDFDFTGHHLPEFILPDGKTDAAEYLKELCLAGAKKLYNFDNEDERVDGSLTYSKKDVLKRLDYELEMITKMGFVDYFLIVADFIDYARRNEIPVGPGRGSAAGSVASYCLGITAVDPLKYNLYFERFLNPERISMPDIDIDFCERRRGEVVEYVKQKYGANRVAQITTFNSLKAKNAVRSVSKALGLTFQEESNLAKEIPNRLNITISEALKTSSRLREMYDEDPRIKNVINTASALEDMPKDSGTHAAGVVITKLPVRDYVPLALSKKDESIATQYSMNTLEELGLLKIDFLGLRNLTVIDDTVREIRKTKPGFSIEDIPEDDTPTYEMLAQGKTSGVFQMESEGMTTVGVGIAAKSIDDIAAVIALYRPGPMESIPKFIENSRDSSKIKYLDPALEPILGVSYGCIVYQEHVIDILRKLGGFSIGQADMIRRAMSKKKLSEIQKERKPFIDGDDERGITGAVANGIPREIAGQIYDSVIPFADYGFNKSHAVAYAIVAYQTAYLKKHYTCIYMAALLSSVLNYPEKVAEYTSECRNLGIKLLPPDINESDAMFTVSGGDIRYGLVAVKNIGRGFINEVTTKRMKDGHFKSFEDFCKRMFGGDLNRRALESLIKCGCFDRLGANRRQLLMICQTVIDSVAEHNRRNVEGQIDLFGMSSGLDGQISGEIELPDLQEYPKGDLTRMEREVTGLYLSGHPMDDFKDVVKRLDAVDIGELLSDFSREEGNIKFRDSQKVLLAGIIESVKTKPTRNNSLMAYISLDDGTGSIEMLAFQRVIDESGVYMHTESMVLAYGKVSDRDEKEPQIVLDMLRPITDTQQLTSLNQISNYKTQIMNIKTPPKYANSYKNADIKQNTGRSNNDNNIDNNNDIEPVKTLYVKLCSEEDPKYERLKLIHMMFPGKQRMVIYFEDTKKSVGASCIIHDAFIKELNEMLGEKNVIIK